MFHEMETKEIKIKNPNPNSYDAIELEEAVYEKLCSRAKKEGISPSLLAQRLLQLDC